MRNLERGTKHGNPQGNVRSTPELGMVIPRETYEVPPELGMVIPRETYEVPPELGTINKERGMVIPRETYEAPWNSGALGEISDRFARDPRWPLVG